MHRSLELIAVIFSVIGSVEISYVESRIIAKGGMDFCEDPAKTKYWSTLSIPERCLFWTGLPMLAAPFLIALAGCG